MPDPDTWMARLGLVSSVDDLVAFGRMLLSGGDKVLRSATVDDMISDQLTSVQRARVWPGFSFLDDRGGGYGYQSSTMAATPGKAASGRKDRKCAPSFHWCPGNQLVGQRDARRRVRR